ncbi:hypothetical protein [Myxococcus phage Mx1]|nr:hypothetical protein [Myxococcus phage Mx1]
MFLKAAGHTWNGKFFYVESLPGQGGVDWGYTTDPKQAAPLSAAMIERFRKHCEYVRLCFTETLIEA